MARRVFMDMTVGRGSCGSVTAVVWRDMSGATAGGPPRVRALVAGFAESVVPASRLVAYPRRRPAIKSPIAASAETIPAIIMGAVPSPLPDVQASPAQMPASKIAPPVSPCINPCA